MNLDETIKRYVDKDSVVLDIGCGDKSRSKDLGCKKVISIDAWDKVQPDIQLDLSCNDLPFEPNSVDVTLMIDFIEHVEKDRGKELIEQAKLITNKYIILLTPLWWQDNAINVENPDLWCYGNKYDYHKSLWKLEDFSEWKRILNIQDLDNYFVGVYAK